MAEVPVWHLFAYMNDDETADESRLVPEWRLDDVVRWARHRGYDNILLSRTAEGLQYRPAEPSGVLLES